MPRSPTHTHPNPQKIDCTMQAPIQLLIDKLSHKSTDLYIFWQNYDHMYRQFNEKMLENARLREELEDMRRMLGQRDRDREREKEREKKVEVVREDPYLKDRLKSSQAMCQQLRAQITSLKSAQASQKSQTSHLLEQISQMQLLISQLREQNSQQRQSIANILQKLKQAQQELTGQEKIYEQLVEKDRVIARLVEREREMQGLLEERDEEVERMGREFREAKGKYERIIKESMQNAKETVMNSLPPNYKTIAQKIRNTEY